MCGGIPILGRQKAIRKEWNSLSTETQDNMVIEYASRFKADIHRDGDYSYALWLEKTEEMVLTLREENHLENLKGSEYSLRYKRRREPSLFVDSLIFPTLAQAGSLARLLLDYLGRKLLHDVDVNVDENMLQVIVPSGDTMKQQKKQDKKKKISSTKKKTEKNKKAEGGDAAKKGQDNSETDEGVSDAYLTSTSSIPSESERIQIDEDLEFMKSHFSSDAFEGDWLVVGHKSSVKKDAGKRRGGASKNNTTVVNNEGIDIILDFSYKGKETPVNFKALTTTQKSSSKLVSTKIASSLKCEYGHISQINTQPQSTRKREISGNSITVGTIEDRPSSCCSLHPEQLALPCDISISTGREIQPIEASKLSFRERVARAARNREAFSPTEWSPLTLDQVTSREDINPIWTSVKIFPELEEKSRPEDVAFHIAVDTQLTTIITDLKARSDSLKSHFDCVLERLRKIVRDSFNEDSLSLSVYGSVATGLLVPGSDMDTCLTGISNLTRDEGLSLLQTLSDNLALFAWVVEKKYIPTASIPVLKLVVRIFILDDRSQNTVL